MPGTIVVPLDGSSLAERALSYGSAIAAKTGASLLIVRATQVGADEPEMTGVRNYLRSTATQLPGRVQFEIERGRPAEVITQFARKADSSIIVMSTHGRGGIHRWMTGSVADEVVRSAGVPVLLVRGDTEIPENGMLDLQSILVPVDGSEYGEAGAHCAIELARAFGSRIHLLTVVDTPSAYAMLSRHMETAATGNVLDEIIQSMRDEAEGYIEQLSQKISDQGIEVKSITLEGYPGEQVIEYERRGFFQLVVMATAGRSGVSRVVFGSVAERVLKLGRSPVMMIRPGKVDQ